MIIVKLYVFVGIYYGFSVKNLILNKDIDIHKKININEFIILSSKIKNFSHNEKDFGCASS